MFLRLLSLFIFALGYSAPVHAIDTLRILTWPGYADNDMVKAFEKHYSVKVEVTFVSSDQVLRSKISANQGRDFDVFAANTAEMHFYMEQQLVQPLRLANIPNASRQLPRFRNTAIPGITRAGVFYAIPYTYAEMGLIYDRQQFKEAPASLSILWDQKYQGRVLMFNDSSHNFSIASLMLAGKPFQIEDQKFASLARHLIALRRNVLSFYTLPEESVELFRRHRIALLFANYGKQQLKMLRDAGADVGYVIPREGALAWLDCWAITRTAKNQRLAESWINYTLDKKNSAEFSRRHGLANTIEVDSANKESDKIIWLEPVENDSRRAALWSSIISGDLPGKF
jgi:putative spermidine/putrescine transport system substrate-binding protein